MICDNITFGDNMLIKFKVGNFRSYNEIQEFSMIKGRTRALNNHIVEKGGVGILKNAILFGPNASGKSAFVEAIQASQSLIVNVMGYPQNIRRSYCRIDETNKERSTYFEYVIEIDRQFYSYGFEIVLFDRIIKSEWLCKLLSTHDGVKEEIVFERDSDSKDEYLFGDMFKKDDLQRLNTYAADMAGKVSILFLNEMNRKNFGNNSRLNLFHEISSWFLNKLLVNRMIMPDRNVIRDAGKVLSCLDTDVSGVILNEIDNSEIQKLDPNLKEIYENLLRMNKNTGQGSDLIMHPDGICFELSGDNDLRVSELSTKHNSSDSIFSISEESSGTTLAFSFMPVLTSDKDDITYIMDEFGTNFHPKLSIEFMKLFQEHNKNMSNQLIVTTHEVILMDLNMFRRDEIWFVEKTKGLSTIYSLEEFKERFDKSVGKAYLEGLYGAVPQFSRLL